MKRPRTNGSGTPVRGKNDAVDKKGVVNTNGVVNKHCVLCKNDALERNDVRHTAATLL
jgi:hypothetical protein